MRASASPIPAVSVNCTGDRERRQKSSCSREVGVECVGSIVDDALDVPVDALVDVPVGAFVDDALVDALDDAFVDDAPIDAHSTEETHLRSLSDNGTATSMPKDTDRTSD